MNTIKNGLNPYFIGLPILIIIDFKGYEFKCNQSQSLFYWITYSYYLGDNITSYTAEACLNPYFIGLPILMARFRFNLEGLNLSQSLFYWITYSYFRKSTSTSKNKQRLNPYFIGLPILIR